MKIHDMESHPAADIFPMMTGEDFDALKEDIEQHGLLEPIVLDEDERILDGRNRYRACVDLEMDDDSIDFVSYEGEQSPIDFVISLNLKRRHLNESQRAMVGAKAVEIYQAEAATRMKKGTKADPKKKGESRKKAADTVNVSARSVGNAAKVLKGGSDDLIEQVEAGNLAVDSARLIAERPHAEQDEIVALVVSGDAKNLRQAVRMFDEARRVKKSKGKKKPTDCEVYVGDAREVLPDLKNRSVHCALFDGPYGIETHSTRGGTKDYADGEQYIRELYPDIFEELRRILTVDGHGYCFAGYDFAWLIRDLLGEAGFYVQRNPIIWVKDNHTMADFAKHYPNKHEYVWHFKQPKGMKRKLRACIPDVIQCPRENVTTHSAEKPVALCKAFIEQSTDPGEKILDPFVGGGSTLVAAAELGRSAIGIELEEKWADIALSRVS